MFESEYRDVDRAAETFTAGHRRLFRPDGVTRLYSDVEHDARVEDLTTALDEALTKAEEAANTAGREALAFLGNAPDHRMTAMDQLSEQDLARANTRRPFIEEDAKHLNPRELVSRAQMALDARDRAATFLLARYGSARLETEAASGRGGHADVLLLRRAVDALWDTFRDPQLPEKKKQAQKTREAASALRRHILTKRIEVTGIDQAREDARRFAGSRL